MKNHVVISIQYAGLMLPIYKTEEGFDVTPLKPIVSDVLGIQWEIQRKKVTESEFLRRELGVCTPLMGGADDQKREQTCIKIDRVAYFLMTINPDRVRANGNISGAEYLEAKISEWADALHDYEEMGVAINLNHVRAQDALRRSCLTVGSLLKTKALLASKPERQLVDRMIVKMSSDIGVTYQPDLLDA